MDERDASGANPYDVLEWAYVQHEDCAGPLMSLFADHVFVHAVPLSVADWMYMFLGRVAVGDNIRRLVVIHREGHSTEQGGEPMMYSSLEGSTG